ncbi:MAG: hypothetical protein K0R57_4110 [Paenibacillaceae bacterium]|jgi:hypothetical protein|nr:hypothetical protein [Paenibacillaceae bacterium]
MLNKLAKSLSKKLESDAKAAESDTEPFKWFIGDIKIPKEDKKE